MKSLTPEEQRVMREGGTEAPFTGAYLDNHEKGLYHCKQCGNVLFTSDSKFDSGTGWPSFNNPVITENIETKIDDSHSMRPMEVLCKHCGAHLGHLFDDGPIEKGGKRYCINSVCLDFKPEKK